MFTNEQKDRQIQLFFITHIFFVQTVTRIDLMSNHQQASTKIHEKISSYIWTIINKNVRDFNLKKVGMTLLLLARNVLK